MRPAALGRSAPQKEEIMSLLTLVSLIASVLVGLSLPAHADVIID